MSTINGIGTTRYDWNHFPDGTAEATLWFVFAFLPVLPIKRQRLRVVSEGLDQPSAIGVGLATLGVAAGYAEGFNTRLELIGPVPMNWRGALRTYAYGYILVPLIALAVPVVVGWCGLWLLERSGVDMRKHGDYIIIPYAVIAVF